MVRARRVRAVVACVQSDECCSPNPKRKDQGHNVTQAITHFFTPVKTSDEQHILTQSHDINDLDDVEKEKFKELPDVVVVVAEEHREEKVPTTPHRIELREEKEDGGGKEALQELRTDAAQRETLFKELQLPLLERQAVHMKALPERVGLDVQEAARNTGTKARRRLNNNRPANQHTQSAANAENAKAGNRKLLTDFFPVRRSERKTKKTVLEEKRRTLEDDLRRGVEKGLRIYTFEGKGRGVVAMRLFNRGDFVVEYAGDLIDMQEARGRELKYAQDQNAGCYMYYFKHKNTQYCIDATAETGRMGRLVNHSRSGNLVTRVIDVDQTPRLVLVARETIEIGEEVTYDYGDRSKESLRHHPWLAY